MKKIIVLIVVQLIRVNISFAETAYVPFATTLAKSGTEFSLTAEYFNTTSVIDTNGDVSSFDSDTTFQKTDVDLNLKYGFTDRFEGQLMLKGRSITSKFNADFGDGLQDYTSSQTGAESAGIGFKFSSKEMEGVKYALEGWYKNAFYSVDRFESGEPGKLSLGEGSREYAIGGNIYFRTKSRTVLDARVYYRSPGETLSKEIFSQFQLALVW
ncbi:MAG: hypothetical protein HON90_15805, partial [Halobacteriovoraceae bacterium]|nr:hypothetical protein [Halobacteriovoraceae bacterium]